MKVHMPMQYALIYGNQQNKSQEALSLASFCTCVLWWQEMEIIMEDGHSVDEMKTQEQYHFAMGGKSFAVITEHFQDLLQKVQEKFFKICIHMGYIIYGIYVLWLLV